MPAACRPRWVHRSRHARPRATTACTWRACARPARSSSGRPTRPNSGSARTPTTRCSAPRCNAYDPALSAGGSSGGAAVALALGMLPVADGSDMGGSLRNPAAFNNVIGFRPSRGRVPGSPDEELFLQQLGCEGPMARTVEDAARLLAVQAGFDARVPLVADRRAALARHDQLDGDVKGLRIGWLGSMWPDLPLAPGVRELCESALQTFRDLGCQVEPHQLDVPREQNWTAWLRLRQLLVGGKLAAAVCEPALREQLKPEARWEIEQSHQLDAAALYQASVYRSNVYRAFLRAFESFDCRRRANGAGLSLRRETRLARSGRRCGERHLPPLDGNRHALHARRAAHAQRARGLWRRRPADGPADRRARFTATSRCCGWATPTTAPAAGASCSRRCSQACACGLDGGHHAAAGEVTFGVGHEAVHRRLRRLGRPAGHVRREQHVVQAYQGSGRLGSLS